MKPDPPFPGVTQERIGPYRIVKRLGHGGQGTVYLADDPKLGRKVALKVLSGIPTLSPKSLQRFRREAEITAQLDHPGICTTYDFGEEAGVPWIAMRYVEGATLSNLISAARLADSASTSEHLSFGGGDLPPRDAHAHETATPIPPTTRTREEIEWVVRVIERAARALHAAHEKGVVHRDVKPANIMVTPDGGAVILDFGLASAFEADAATLTMSGDLMGTPQYLAPEQLTHEAILPDRRADVYSLGITLYEALTLARPFDSPTRERLYQAIIAKEPADPHRLNPAISRDLSAVVATAIEKDRDRRYQSALELADDCRRYLAREPVLARRAGPGRRFVKWVERNPVVAGAIATVFIVLVAALLVAIELLREKDDALARQKATLAEFENLSDVKRVHDLKAAAPTLFPVLPSKAPAMKEWLERAHQVASRLPLHVQALDALRSREAAGAARLEDPWKREYLTELIRNLETFKDPDPHVGALADVEQRLAFAESVVKRSIGDYSERWKAATEAIADRSRTPKYDGLSIKPQVGLVPLGQNPTTGLWEFADVQSGTLPETDGRDATHELEQESAIVLVLLPGGTYTMGSPRSEPGRKEEGEDQHEETVPAIFFAKYEVTQAQWQRIMGWNPSGLLPQAGDVLAYPVESVDWIESAEFATRVNMMLPSEVEWEYACRADAKTAFAWGNDPSCLQGHANVGDRSLEQVEKQQDFIARAGWFDGFRHTAPVNAFETNGFGLHGFHGNVGEWCRDWFALPPRSPVPKDGGERPERDSKRAWRDGSWFLPPESARAAARHSHDPKTKANAIGLRVARFVDP